MRKNLAQRYSDVMPKGAGALFFIQLFATITFSVLYSSLVLYLTNGLKLDDISATSITATFVAFNYSLHLLGGYIGGRYMSYRSLFVIGMALTVIGANLIALPYLNSLYWGLACFLTGAGLNVTCINCMLTQLFQPTDHRREAAFLWNYSGMNIGFFAGFTISGYFQLRGEYHLLFMMSGFANLISLALTLFKWQLLGDLNTLFKEMVPSKKNKSRLIGIFIIILLVLSLRVLLEHAVFSNQVVIAAGLCMLGVLITLSLKQTDQLARKKLWAYIILALTSLVFWSLYQLAPMGLSLFVERNVNRHYLGMHIATQWAQNINTLVIIFGAPLFSLAFTRMREAGVQLSLSLQFAIALMLIGIAFAILPIGIYLSDANGYTSFTWIIASYAMQSLGELFISPIGFAMIGQLAPVKLQGLMMGTWLMITGVAATVSSYFSKLALGPTQSIDPLITNNSFSHTFLILGFSAIMAGFLLAFAIRFITQLTQEQSTLHARP